MAIVKKPSFTAYIRQRIRQNKNFLGLITGATGSGKSYSAIRLAELLDPEFSIERCAFTSKQFMEIINSGQLKKGSVVVYDEIGIGMNSRAWQSIGNRMLHYLMQSFRNLNLIVLMTCPDASFLDVGARKLLHAVFTTEGIDFNRKVCRLKPKLLQVNQSTGKIYMKYLRVWNEQDGLIPFVMLNAELPSKQLRQEYELKKTEYTQELNEKIQKAIEQAEQSEASEFTIQQKKVLDYLIAGHKPKEIAELMNINLVNVYKHLKFVKKKGIIITAIKEGNKVMRYDVEGYP